MAKLPTTTSSLYANAMREVPHEGAIAANFIPTAGIARKQNNNEFRLPRPRVTNTIDFSDIDPNKDLKDAMKNITTINIGR